MLKKMIVKSPIGELVLVGSASALTALHLPESDEVLPPEHAEAERGKTPLLERVAAQLREYFAGKRKKFTFPLAPRGTEFQQRVWDELLRIPYGATVSYGELAARCGNPSAQRAVARANATNPIAVVVPCHRVIGADGTLTGYGGGLDKKRRLLELEGALLPMGSV